MRRLLMAAVLVCAAGAGSASSPSPAAETASACLPAPTVPGVTEGRSAPGTVAPSIGVLRVALLLVHASDTPPDTGPVVRDTFDAAAAWFRAVSYGRLDLRVEPTPHSLALPATSAAYAADPKRYLRDAIAAADPHVDFTSSDVVYLAPASRTPRVPVTTANLYGFGLRADGKEIRLWIPWGAGFAAEAGEPGSCCTRPATCWGSPTCTARAPRRPSTAGT